MRIIFFGTPAIATPVLTTLSKIPGFDIEMVITQPDKPVGRNRKVTPPPVKVAAEKLGIKVKQPENKKQLEKILHNAKADFFIVIAYGMIIPKHLLNIPTFGSFNIHFSLLPKYRGASPMQESLLRGDKETGITVIKMDEKMDHGPILFSKRIRIEDNDDIISLSVKLSNLSSQILPFLLEDITNGSMSLIEQDEKKADYCKKIKKSDGKIDWEKSAEEIKNMTRAYKIWPGTFTYINNKKLKIISADVEKSNKKQKPGKFILGNKTLKISTSKDLLVPKKVQMEGKKEMDIETFLNGYKNLISSTNQSEIQKQ